MIRGEYIDLFASPQMGSEILSFAAWRSGFPDKERSLSDAVSLANCEQFLNLLLQIFRSGENVEGRRIQQARGLEVMSSRL